VESLRQHPLVGARYALGNPLLRDLRSWPVVGFEAIRIYYLVEEGTLHVIRVLHGKRDVKSILDREESL
jgi:toxin ParE1/3/4